MATNSGGAVAVADSHGSARGRASSELKSTTDLPIGSSSPKERKRKRKAEESDAEDSRGAAEPGDREGSEGEGVAKKERKRNKKKRKEREPDSDEEKENEKGPKGTEKKKKRGKGERRSKGRSSSPLKEDVDALSDRASPSAPPSPPDSNSTTATVSSGNKNPSKSSIRNKINTEERRLLRKSVSFTPDTKATDGDSIKTLYENHDPFAHYASYQQHINDYPTNELPEGFDDDEPKPKKLEPKGDHKRFDNSEPAPIPELSQKKRKMREKREKRQKKKEAKEDAEDEANGSEGGAKLSYLLTYHTSRDTWRFEKGKQNWILRHAFNLSKIPEEGYATALKSYITGLQSPAARDRLLAEASEIVKRGKDTISKDGDKLDPEDQKTSVTRAKLVLSALGHEDDEGDDEEEEDSSDEEEE